MMLFWKIRCLDRADKQFKDRCLYLNTKKLAPVERAAVELIVQNDSSNTKREILKYRHFYSGKTRPQLATATRLRTTSPRAFACLITLRMRPAKNSRPMRWLLS